mgnify:CR=1 FL=1
MCVCGGGGGGGGEGAGAGGGSFAGGEDDSAEAEYSVPFCLCCLFNRILLTRLSAARPPSEVLKAAVREAKRLKSGGDHQPGAAAARAYLEILADLPWNTMAWQSTAAAAAAAAGGGKAAAGQKAATAASAADGAKSSKLASEQQQQQQQQRDDQEVRGPPVPMPLSAARALLDSQHTGLEKVKERIIEHLAVSRLLGPANMGQGRSPVLCLIGKFRRAFVAREGGGP